jgi:hypothetical protein
MTVLDDGWKALVQASFQDGLMGHLGWRDKFACTQQ